VEEGAGENGGGGDVATREAASSEERPIRH